LDGCGEREIYLSRRKHAQFFGGPLGVEFCVDERGRETGRALSARTRARPRLYRLSRLDSPSHEKNIPVRDEAALCHLIANRPVAQRLGAGQVWDLPHWSYQNCSLRMK
jgi:hypothetical protein